MKKVYIRFGELHQTDFVDIYQGLIEKNIVKIVIPNASYRTYQTLASHVDDPVYIVDGDEIDDNTHGGYILVNTRIVGELKLDKETNNYIADQETLWRMNNKPKRKNNIVYEKNIFGLINRVIDYWNEELKN